MDMTRTDNPAKWASGVNFILGIWLIISAFTLHLTTLRGAVTNNVIIGIVVLILAAIRTWTNAMRELSWVNFILGIWLIVSPFVLAYTMTKSFTWNNVIVGIIVAGLAAWSALATSRPPAAA